MHQIKSAAGSQYPRRCLRNIFKTAQHLMSRDRFRLAGVGQSMAARHVRRIAGDHIEGCRRKILFGAADVTLYDLDPFLHPVIFHTSLCHIRAFMLDFQAGEMLSFRLRLQQDRNDPGARTEIQRPLPFLHLRIRGEQHRIDPITELFRILYHPVAILQIVQTLSRTEQF